MIGEEDLGKSCHINGQGVVTISVCPWMAFGRVSVTLGYDTVLSESQLNLE